MPLPRYVKRNCCDDTEHITNRSEPDFEQELNNDLEMVEDLLIGWAQSHQAGQTLIHFRALADEPAANISKLSIKGDSYWCEADPVHCVSAVYAALARAVVSAHDELSDIESVEPVKKRPRLESVVVVREPGANVTAAPAPKLQGWSSGLLPSRPSHGGGLSGSNSRGGKDGWPR
jgi:hypothetical protein